MRHTAARGASVRPDGPRDPQDANAKGRLQELVQKATKQASCVQGGMGWRWLEMVGNETGEAFATEGCV